MMLTPTACSSARLFVRYIVTSPVALVPSAAAEFSEAVRAPDGAQEQSDAPGPVDALGFVRLAHVLTSIGGRVLGGVNHHHQEEEQKEQQHQRYHQ